MNNDMIQLPVYSVHGVNWVANVAMTKYDIQFPPAIQMLEAAARAIEVWKGVKVKGEYFNPHNIIIQIDEGEKEPILGPAILVHIKDNPEIRDIIPSHIVLADCGFYADSVPAQIKWDEEMEAERKAQEKSEQQRAMLNASLAEFEQLRQDIKSKETKPNKVSKRKNPRKKSK